MELPEEIFERVHQSLTRLGMKIERADVESSLIKPGEERLQLIRCALSELGIVVKEENGNLFLTFKLLQRLCLVFIY